MWVRLPPTQIRPTATAPQFEGRSEGEYDQVSMCVGVGAATPRG